MYKADSHFEVESICTAGTAWTRPWSYCFCYNLNVCLWRVPQYLLRLWSGSGLQYQFTCCPRFAGAVNSCLKHSPKLLFYWWWHRRTLVIWWRGVVLWAIKELMERAPPTVWQKQCLSHQNSYIPVEPTLGRWRYGIKYQFKNVKWYSKMNLKCYRQGHAIKVT